MPSSDTVTDLQRPREAILGASEATLTGAGCRGRTDAPSLRLVRQRAEGRHSRRFSASAMLSIVEESPQLLLSNIALVGLPVLPWWLL